MSSDDDGELHVSENAIEARPSSPLGVGSLYPYFPDKKAILFRLQVDEWARTSELLDALFADRSRPPAGAPPRGFLQTTMGALGKEVSSAIYRRRSWIAGPTPSPRCSRATSRRSGRLTAMTDFIAREQALTAWFSERMLDVAELRPGMRVLDIATGRGEPAARAAARVAHVVGIDANAEAIALGRTTAPPNLELRVGDAASPVEGAFDVVLCRWGLSFFPDPVAALRAMRGALVPGGAVVLAVWVTVPWTPGVRALRHADPAVLARELEAAGLRLVSEEEHDVAILEAAGRDEVSAWSAAFGGIAPATDSLRLVGRSRIVLARA